MLWRGFLILLTSLALVACARGPKMKPPAEDARRLMLDHAVTREHRDGRVIFPAGLYTPEAQSAEGVYYSAPQRLETGSIVRGGYEHGGLFIRHDGVQMAWVGQPGYQLQQAPGTILGLHGVERPQRMGFSQPVPFRWVETR
jgi:hypothetical protein